jgi:hypothetical protein
MQTTQQMSQAVPTERIVHGRRRPHLPPMQPGEAERLVAEFLSQRRITVCPTRYAVALEQAPQLARGRY